MSKRLKFYHTRNWYTRKPKSIQENETQKIYNFDLQIDHLILARGSEKKLSILLMPFEGVALMLFEGVTLMPFEGVALMPFVAVKAIPIVTVCLEGP